MALIIEKSIIVVLLLRYWMKYVDFTLLSNMVFHYRWRLITSCKWTMYCVEVKTSTIHLRLDFWFVSSKEKIVFLTQRIGWFIHDFSDCALHTFCVSHLIFKMYLFISVIETTLIFDQRGVDVKSFGHKTRSGPRMQFCSICAKRWHYCHVALRAI